MAKADYVVRLIDEAEQLSDRICKLQAIITGYASGTLDFDPDCPLELLLQQYSAMHQYLMVLWRRLEIEA